ncbi:Uracil-DNA glycosylase [gamma proteobacterium IMCC1989]|nr:Uracil-DNA glycosylase [gamma proteobacterium IMCC1989]
MSKIDLPSSWLVHVESEFSQSYMKQLKLFLQAEKREGKTIYPASDSIFNAFKATPFNDVKVVVLGQDPYHGIGQAHGLSFSVPKGVRTPPSLVNIFKEANRDLGIQIPSHGCLQSWAEQGVLLLNATLTVEQANAGSHQGQGWELFTDKVIEVLSDQREHVVFLLWGSYAQKKGRVIDQNKHLVLRSAHPSPLSAYRGFIGNGHFSATNEYLEKHGQSPIDWQVV